jgi:aryl-alcohol dehydrogenase-like predicted oxidoreductase
MMDRRVFLGSLASLPLISSTALAWQGKKPAATALHSVRIAGSKKPVPVVGIGTSRRYNDPQNDEQLAALRASIARFVELGGRMIDTAPVYGRAEAVVGQLVEELGVRDKLFIATKVGVDDRAQGVAQIEQSFKHLRTNHIDLIAVHNLRDVTAELATLRELKSAGRIGSLGVTTASDTQYADLEATMRREALDVIQVDYALDNRGAADRILPLAQEKGMAIMINLPFGRGRLFQATEGRPLPDWAAEIGATTWAQVFLKYIVSHPSRPIAIPGMAQTRYVDDNLGAARGPLPDEAMRRWMEQYIGTL